jgi:hypothetical protein
MPGAATNGHATRTKTAELLRFATAGSVDDGKSTLIGRLLFDSKQILVDQLDHVVQTSERRGDGYVNFALLTDGLRAEREQGTSPTATSRRRAASSSSPTPRGTSSTRATWSRERRRPTSRSCSSMRARA